MIFELFGVIKTLVRASCSDVAVIFINVIFIYIYNANFKKEKQFETVSNLYLTIRLRAQDFYHRYH